METRREMTQRQREEVAEDKERQAVYCAQPSNQGAHFYKQTLMSSEKTGFAILGGRCPRGELGLKISQIIWPE
jgi:hypothetical protein